MIIVSVVVLTIVAVLVIFFIRKRKDNSFLKNKIVI